MLVETILGSVLPKEGEINITELQKTLKEWADKLEKTEVPNVDKKVKQQIIGYLRNTNIQQISKDRFEVSVNGKIIKLKKDKNEFKIENVIDKTQEVYKENKNEFNLGFTTQEIVDVVKEAIKSFSPYLPIDLAEKSAEEFVKNLLANINRELKLAKGYEEEEQRIKGIAEELLSTDEFKELGISSLDIKIVENDYLPVYEGRQSCWFKFWKVGFKR